MKTILFTAVKVVGIPVVLILQIVLELIQWLRKSRKKGE